MQIKKYNISKAGRKYQDNQGNEKTIWHNIGTLTEFYKEDGSINRVIEIPAIGLEASAFPIVPKETQAPTQKPKNQEINVPTPDGIDYPEEDINPEDIPF